MLVEHDKDMTWPHAYCLKTVNNEAFAVQLDQVPSFPWIITG